MTGRQPDRKNDRRVRYQIVLVFAVLAVVVLATGYYSYQNYEREHRTEVEHQLSAVAGMEVTKLVQWKSERINVPGVFFHNPLFSSRVQHLFNDSSDTESQGEVMTWLEKEQANSPYDRVYLMDTTGALRMSVPETQTAVASSVLKQVNGTLQSDKVTLIDFYRDDIDQRIYLAVLVPVFDDEGSGNPLGVLAFQIDPGRDLYPFINEWPAPSNSAETQLIRREGNDVVYLNGLRYNPDTPLTLRIPLNRTNVPAVQAVLGGEGIVDGVDYQGVPVIADIQKVPGTPWFLVARMDASEVYGPLRERALLLILIIAILLAGAGAGIGLIWRDQNIRFNKEMYEVENAFLKERLRAQSYLDIVGTTILSINADQTVALVNLAGCRLLGRREEDIIGKNWFDTFLPEREREDAKKSFAQEIDGSMGYSEQIERNIVTASGEERLVAWHITLIRDENQTITGTLRSGEDITERKRAEETLADSELFNRGLVENLPEYIIVYGPDGKILYVNPATEKALGYNAKELVGTSVLSYVADEHREEVISMMKARHEGRENPAYETDIVAQDGHRRSVITKGTPVRYHDSPAFLILLIDITERKELEKEMEYHAQELQQYSTSLATANKKLNLLSSITRHDINNQLTILTGYLAFLENKQPDPTLTEYFLRVSNAAKRISAMVKFTREYEEIGVKAPIWHDCRTLVDTAAKQAPLGMVVVKNHLPAGAEVFADPLVIKVFYNLMDNAVRYGKKITTIQFSVEELKGNHVVMCKDDGDGVLAEEKEKIFERGFGKNTGLGLALSREILSITGITIRETGEPGTGARFEMTVPKGAYRPGMQKNLSQNKNDILKIRNNRGVQ